MTYIEQSWIDDATPVDAGRLNHMEAGIAAADLAANGARDRCVLAHPGLALPPGVWSPFTGLTTKLDNNALRVGDQITIKKTGSYWVFFQIEADGAATPAGTAANVALFLNGAVSIDGPAFPIAGSLDGLGTSGGSLLDLVAGDDLYLQAMNGHSAAIVFRAHFGVTQLQ